MEENENKTGQIPPLPMQYVTYLPYGMTAETYGEKKELRKKGNTIGISLLITEGFFSFWSILYFYIAGYFGISKRVAYEWVSEPAVQQVLQVVLSAAGFLIPAILLFRAREQTVSELVPLSAPKKGGRVAMFFFGMAFCMFANIAVSMLGDFFANFGIEYHAPRTENPEGVFGFLLAFLATAIFPALIEEFVFRGLILGSLKKYGEGFAVLASAILFGLVHNNFEQIPFAFLVGLALGFIVVQTGSLWIAVAVHAANNFISVFFSYFLRDSANGVSEWVYALMIMAYLVLGLLSLLPTGKREGGFRLQRANTAATEKQKYQWLFTTPVIVVFSGICLLEAVISLWEEML